MATGQRAFSKRIIRHHASDVRKTVSAVTEGKNPPRSSSVATISSVTPLQEIFEPVDYEDFLDQHHSDADCDPLRNILYFPSDDIKVVSIPRRIRTVEPVVPCESEGFDSHIYECVRCYTKDWIHVSREYIHHSTSTDAKAVISPERWQRIQACPSPEFEVDLDEERMMDDVDQEIAESKHSNLSHTTPRGSWASSAGIDLRNSVGDALIPGLLSRVSQDSIDATNNAERMKHRQESLFLLYAPQDEEDMIEKRFYPDLPMPHTGHRIMVKCINLKLELEIEPIFASMALYDIKEKKKISENFNFDMNPEALKKMLNSHIPYQDISSLSRCAVFNISQPSSDLYLVVRLEKVLQGDMNDVLNAYIKDDLNKDKLKTSAVTFCERLGKYRMPLGWTAINLVDLVLENKDSPGDAKEGSVNLDRKPSSASFEEKRKNSSLSRRGSLERRSFNEKRRSWSNEEFGSWLDSFQPVTLTVSPFYKQESDRLRDEDLYKFLPELKRSSNQLKKRSIPGKLVLNISPVKEMPKYCRTAELARIIPYPADEKCRPIKECVEFPANPIHVPHYSYRNLLFVSPKDLNFANRPGSARNIAVKVQFMAGEDEQSATCSIFGKSSCPEFTTESFTAVTYHSKCPDFYDEFKISLPAFLGDQHHLFFTFYHISCQKKSDEKVLDTPVGYTWLPIFRDGSLKTGEHVLPVMLESPPSNYSYITADIQLPGTKWVDNHKGIFTVHIDAVSTVHPQDDKLDKFFLLCKMVDERNIPARIGETKMEGELKKAMADLVESQPDILVQFIPVLFDKLISLMVQPPVLAGQSANLSSSAFNTISILVERIVKLLADKNDNHGRNATLLAYLSYQATLPHPEAMAEPPTTSRQNSYERQYSEKKSSTSSRSSNMSQSSHISHMSQSSGTLTAVPSHRRSSSNPDLGADADAEVGTLMHRGLDRTNSMRIDGEEALLPKGNEYMNVPTLRVAGHKLTHEEIAFQWVVCKGNDREKAICNAWFFFELMLKSMSEHLSTIGSLKAPRKLRFSHQFNDDIENLVTSITNDILASVCRDQKNMKMVQCVNANLAFFLCDFLSIMDRGFVFGLIRNYCKMVNTKLSISGDATTIINLKIDFVRIVCSHEHYIALNLPFCTPLSNISAPSSPCPSICSSNSQGSFVSTIIGGEKGAFLSLSSSFCQQHFLAGIVLTDLATTLEMNNPCLHGRAVNTIRNLLAAHDTDDRYSDPETKSRVAALYIPLIGICIDALPQIYTFFRGKVCQPAVPREEDTSLGPHIQPNVASAIAGSTLGPSQSIYGVREGDYDLSGPPRCPLTSETSRNLLICLLWVFKNLDESTVRTTIRDISYSKLSHLMDVLYISISAFEYKSKKWGPRGPSRNKADMKSRLEEAIMGQNSARSEMMLRRKAEKITPIPAISYTGPSGTPGGTSSSTPGVRWRKDTFQWKSQHGTPSSSNLGQDSPMMSYSESDGHIEGHLAAEVSMIILDSLENVVHVISQSEHLQSLLNVTFRVLLHSLTANQSISTLTHTFNTQRSLVSKYPSLLFDEETEQCADLCLQLLKHCSSCVSSVRSNAAASLYLLMRHNFEIGNNFARVKMQVTMSLSSLVGTSQTFNEAFLRRSLKTILTYAEEDLDLQDTSFPEQVRDLVFNLHMILSDTVKMKEYKEDPDMLLDLMYRIARGYQNSPDLRLTWLANMAQKHSERFQYAEAAMCLVHSAALVAEYLYILEDTSYLPIGAVAFNRISPNVLEESVVSDDIISPEEEGICTGKYFTENGLVGLLEQASSSFMQAGMFECINEVYKILIPIAESNRDWKKLINIHTKVQEAFSKIDQLEGKRIFGTYFRVGFYGSKFGDMDGEEFVYKEPTLTKLPEILYRLESFFTERFGNENFEIIKDSNTVDVSKLKAEKAYVQITYVEPYFDVYEEEDRITGFEKNYNIKRFIFSTPFTTDGRAHGELHEQYKRKTILTTEHMLPYIKTRVRVVDRYSWVLTPIEVAIEDIQKKTAELTAAITQNPPDYKILQMVLQGCIGTTVNQGPMEVALVFLSDSIDGKKKLDKFQNKLRLRFKDFSRRCHEALKRLNDPSMRNYKQELKRNYDKFTEKLAPMIANNDTASLSSSISFVSQGSRSWSDPRQSSMHS